MKINKLQINAFGKLKDEKIQLSDNINIIKGNNESGKSTLLKFIIDMFYGAAKTKKGKDFSDYERYKPWNTEEFSGKIEYTLDNGKKYEVFRDFNKKNPKIYNENLEDISKEFNIDKTYGNQFFIEQTKIDEDMFLSTLVSMQQEVKLEKQEQNLLVQKIANLAGTGEDNVSYKKALDKINKRQIEEIGTLRTTGRPMNVVKDEKYKLQDEIGELEEYKDKKYEIEDIKKELEKQIEDNENKLRAIKEMKIAYEETKIDKEKVNFNENIIKANNEKICNLQKQREEIANKNNDIQKEEKHQEKIVNNKAIMLTIILAIIVILAIIFINNKIMLISFTIAGLLDTLILVYSIISTNIKRKKKKQEIENQKQKERQIKQELQNEIDKLDSQIEILSKNNEEQLIETTRISENVKNNINEKLKQIESKYPYVRVESLNNLTYEIENLENTLNKERLNIHVLELDKNNIMPKLEKLSSMEEKLDELNEREEQLIKSNESMEIAKEVLEIAYTKMKENVTPKFTENLSNNINKISDGKYKNVRIHDENGIVVEKENGEYVEAEKLSVGTIDQLYMSLRFGAIKELAQENMPIILDESFAYYDGKRLKNILQYLNTELKNNQIIILTCTDREIELLEKMNISANIVELT